ncbi:hypothetical protein [Subtercola boreus]|uniref:hypothetical protein n=1 Tax=Subtercola boreus TaxID=120213 RepID=UPI00115250B2|nr:hypothetical protein [Subtercola boreus]
MSKPSLALISDSQTVRYGGYFLTLIGDDHGIRVVGGGREPQDVLNVPWSRVAGEIEPISVMEQTTASNGIGVPILLSDRTERLQIVLQKTRFTGITPPGARATEEVAQALNLRREVASRVSRNGGET